MERDRPHEPDRDRDRPADSTREPARSAEPRREPARPTEPTREPAKGAEPERRKQPDKPHRSEFEVKERRRRNANVVRLVLGLILLVLFILFVSSNSREVQVDFVFFETQASLVLVFLICALVGAIVAFLLGRSGRRAHRKYIKELERRLDERGDKRD
jgi:uncharacterized integral membrane protein